MLRWLYYFFVFLIALFTKYTDCSHFRGVHTSSASSEQQHDRFRDNIGNKDVTDLIAFGPIDAVYTWVNGSDPRWLKKKKQKEKEVLMPTLQIGTEIAVS